jgi:hypothetical protein
MRKVNYKIIREIRPDCNAIIFEFDQDSEAELHRDFSQLEHLGRYAWWHRRKPPTIASRFRSVLQFLNTHAARRFIP